MIINTGNIVTTHPMIFVSYALSIGVATLHMDVEDGKKEIFYLPLVVPEFGLGVAGIESFIHPVHLPPGHPNFVTWLDKKTHTVTHNRTGQKCVLRLDKNFHLDGRFYLTPLDKSTSAVEKSSVQYTKTTATLQLDSLKGHKIIFTGRVTGFKLDGRKRSSILVSKVTKKQQVTVMCTSLEWPTHWALPFRAFAIWVL